jgi:hypothetical protein
MKSKLIITSILILFFSNILFSQHKEAPQQYSLFELKGGVVLEQGLNLGINKYYNRNSDFGIGIGSLLPSKEGAHHFLLNFEHNYNLGFSRRKKIEPSVLFN